MIEKSESEIAVAALLGAVSECEDLLRGIKAKWETAPDYRSQSRQMARATRCVTAFLRNGLGLDTKALVIMDEIVIALEKLADGTEEQEAQAAVVLRSEKRRSPQSERSQEEIAQLLVAADIMRSVPGIGATKADQTALELFEPYSPASLQSLQRYRKDQVRDPHSPVSVKYRSLRQAVADAGLFRLSQDRAEAELSRRVGELISVIRHPDRRPGFGTEIGDQTEGA